MQKVGVALQVAMFLFFLAVYIVFIVPAAVIVAFRKPVIEPAKPRARTTIGLGSNVTRIY